MTGMTKDYAIAILRRMQEPEPFEPQINESAFDALEMAIQALSAQDEDTISRQAALDAIHRYFGSRIENDCPTQLVDGEEIYISTSALDVLLAINKALSQAIKELPSCSKMEQVGDCISRQAAIDAVFSEPLYESGMKKRDVDAVVPAIYEKIKSLPSAQPEQSSEIQDILDYLDTVLHPIISPEHWNVYSELHDMISTLPSVQPDSKDLIGKIKNGITASDGNSEYFIGLRNGMRWCLSLIDDKEPIYESSAQPNVARDIATIIENEKDMRVILAQPEIIYCKDCKHYNAGFECLIEGYGIERNKDWFCGDAERRTDETTI